MPPTVTGTVLDGIISGVLEDLHERQLMVTSDNLREATELVARFAHGPGRFSVFRIPGLDSAANSMEYFIRHEDLLRAQPDWRPRELGHRTELRLADIIRKYGRALARRSPVGVRVEMTGQTDPVTLHPGDRIVTLVGKPSEVILLLTGRTSVAQVDVLGEPPTIAAFMRSDRSL